MGKLDDEIASLEALLNSGAERTEVDGVSVRFNIDHARQRLRELVRQRDGRPQVCKVRLSGGYADY